MKLILFPLMFLIVFAALSQLGLGTVYGEGHYSLRSMQLESVLYDANGHPVCYGNGTATGEGGELVFRASTFPLDNGGLLWDNGTVGGWGLYGQYFPLYWDNGGTQQVKTDLTINETAIGGTGFDLTATGGLLAIIGALIIFVGLISLKIFGFGMSDIGVAAVFKGTAYMGIWAIFTFLAYGLITQIPWAGSVFYFFLTALYTLGIVNSIGSSTEA